MVDFCDLRWTRYSNLSLVLSIAIASQLRGQETQEAEAANAPKPFSVRLVDVAGKPVAGAEVGVAACIGSDIRDLAAKDQTQWYYNQHARSDADGIARLSDAGQLDLLALIARHEKRKLSAVAELDTSRLKDPVELTLVPEIELTGQAVCPELEQRGRPISEVVVYVRSADNTILECSFDDPTVRLSLPPGDYEFEAYASTTHAIKKSIRVAGQPQRQTLEPFPLHATNLALLEGRPAPEIPGIVGWKNSAPIQLADLRGDCVLLEFWGYWCGPCVYRMPALFELYDKYHDRGLKVIAVHVDLAADGEPKVDTAQKLDERLSEIRTTLWKGRDLPFPVALVSGEPTPYREGIEVKARSAAAAVFGIRSYPTQVLIDRHGNVVRRFFPDEKGVALLEKTLAEN